jgi:3-dehydroquinate dehydratase
MELDEAYKKLMERHRELQEKLAELARLAEEVIMSQHQFRRVETEKYQELCEELEATLEDYAAARDRFGRLLEGE